MLLRLDAHGCEHPIGMQHLERHKVMACQAIHLRLVNLERLKNVCRLNHSQSHGQSVVLLGIKPSLIAHKNLAFGDTVARSD